MNNLVRQLIHQSGFDWYAHSGRVLPGSDQVEDLEKLANVVALACIELAEHYGLGSDAVEQLKEDFGVYDE